MAPIAPHTHVGFSRFLAWLVFARTIYFLDDVKKKNVYIYFIIKANDKGDFVK
jgi:hypothetical protein